MAGSADHAFSGLRLERAVSRQTQVLHYRVWYRDALASYIREMLLDSRTLQAYLEGDTVERSLPATHVGSEFHHSNS